MLQSSERRAFDARFAALWDIDPKSVILADDRHAASIKDVGVGGVIALRNETFVVIKMARYVETNEKGTKDKDWFSVELVLFSLKTGKTRYIEWEEDDELEISFVERKLTKQELNQKLRDDGGEVFDVDDDIDEACENEWGVMFDGVLYPYDDDWPVRFESSDGRMGEAYFYEFGSDYVGWLSIEGWKDGHDWDYEGYVSFTLRPQDVEIISCGTAS